VDELHRARANKFECFHSEMSAPSGGSFRRVKSIVINGQQPELALRICECSFSSIRVETF
jgi:hypothetical protein